jgi:hypothetical protein
MAGLRIATLVTVVALLGLIPGVAQAQNAPRMIDLTFKGYFSTLSGTNSAGTVFARGNAPMFGGAFNVYNPQNGIGWGAEYTTGGLSNGEGIWLNLQSSSTRIMSGWVNYNVLRGQPTPVRLNVSAGYEKHVWDVRNSVGSREIFRAQGLRLGVGLTVPFNTGWAVTGRIAYVPSAGTSLENAGGTATATGSLVDYSATVSYSRGDWRFGAGYRWAQDRAGGLTGCSDCRFDWSGTYVQATWHR